MAHDAVVQDAVEIPTRAIDPRDKGIRTPKSSIRRKVKQATTNRDPKNADAGGEEEIAVHNKLDNREKETPQNHKANRKHPRLDRINKSWKSCESKVETP